MTSDTTSAVTEGHEVTVTTTVPVIGTFQKITANVETKFGLHLSQEYYNEPYDYLLLAKNQ